jgi:hypothetical protein
VFIIAFSSQHARFLSIKPAREEILAGRSCKQRQHFDASWEELADPSFS